MSAFALENVSKKYTSREGRTVSALEDVSFAADEGKVTCLVGPTGSGKSTILRLLSGLDTPDSGSVTADGTDPSGLKGGIGLLTQHHTLFPWMKVRDNIALPLEIKGNARAVEKADAICGSLGLSGAGDMYPYELSGGMQQRAALGRLLALEAPLWLLDEPFTHLDERTQHHLQKLVLDLVRENKLSVVFVTHMIDEAVFLADSIVVLSAGPGRVVDHIEPGLESPRDRLSQAYGEAMERVRRSMESVLGE